jgi:hypothetical protein
MPLPALEQARWAYLDWDSSEMDQDAKEGFPYLILDFEDGRTAKVHNEQKLLASGIKAVYIDAAFEDDTKVDVPAWPENGRDAMTVNGATDDPSIVTLVQEFCQAVNEGIFEPKVIMDVAKEPGEET